MKVATIRNNKVVIKKKKNNPIILLGNVHVKLLNQSCKKVDQVPDRVIVKAVFPKP